MTSSFDAEGATIAGVIAACPLCGMTAKIVRSHIIPEFFLRATLDDAGRGIAVRGEPGPTRLVQQAFVYRLLCQSCEKFLNDEYEQPFLAFWREAAPSVVWGPVYLLRVPDYARFKLFLLSILWRAGVCSQGEFRRVQLGEHEPILREMILQRQPHSMHDYPIIAAIMLMPGSVRAAYTVVSPFETTWEGRPGYMFGFGGCAWQFILTRQPLEEWNHEWILMDDGRFGMTAVDMSQLVAIDRTFRASLQLAEERGWRKPWE